MDIKFDWVKPLGTGRGAQPQGIRITRNDYIEKPSGTVRESTVVRIGADAMKKARFVIGDRVLVGTASLEGKSFVAIKRVHDGGYTISSADKGNKGKSLTGHVKMSTISIPLGEWGPEKVSVNDDGVIILRVS
jgi:hypothetical protein